MNQTLHMHMTLLWCVGEADISDSAVKEMLTEGRWGEI